MDGTYYVGVDLGGTYIKAGLVDEHGAHLSNLKLATQADRETETVVSNIHKAAEQAIAEAKVPRDAVAGIGIGSPGPLSHSKGIIYKPANIPCFRNLPLRDIIYAKTGIRTTLENDANAAAWGEFWAGAGRDVKDFIMFTLGTGIGGGIIVDGRMLRGHFENGAEIGHCIVARNGRQCGCGQRGCVEAYSSAHNIATRAAELIGQGEASSLKSIIDSGEELNAKHVEQAAKAGDALAMRVWDDACHYLAVLIVNMQHICNPQRIVLAGGLIAAGDYLLNRVREYAQQETWKLLDDMPEIRFADLGDNAGFIGAAGCAWEACRTGQW